VVCAGVSGRGTGVWAICAIGLRVNGTDSEPIGIYWAISKPPARGDFVFALPPPEPIFKLAYKRAKFTKPDPPDSCLFFL
jgi:type IV secretory pathway protease TraF